MTAVVHTGSRSAVRRVAVLAALGIVALAALLTIGTGPVGAAEPKNLRTQLTDDAGVLSTSEEATVRASLDALQRDTDVQLWVWYTDTTSGQDVVEFAAETAKLSSFGGTDLLLVIAVDDLAYGFSSPAGFPLSDPEIEQLLSRELEPGLRSQDYAGAIVATAGALDTALTETPA
jgi:uncharacterized membrane protein YgcG